jgi:hypothetical protein
MIILDILQNILDIFPHLILGAGYSIFGGMAGGSQSGKLTFKKLYGGTNVTLGANTQIISIYDTTSTSGTPISNCIIAVGTGTDIADSFLSVESGIRKCAINGAAGINSYHTSNNNLEDSMILGGCKATIQDSSRSSILGGCCNIIKHCSYPGGRKSAYDNLILGGRNNKLYTGQNSNLDYLDNSILSGSENGSYCSLNSSILSGHRNFICKVGELPKLTFKLKNSNGVEVSSTATGDEIIQVASKKGASLEVVMEKLSELGETTFYLDVDSSIFDIDTDAFLPLSVLKGLKRDVADDLTDKLIQSFNREGIIYNIYYLFK